MSNPIITVSNVTKVVATQPLLENVSFSIYEQELVSLIGPNGAGKTTLLRIILGLDLRYSGSVTVRPPARIQYIPQQSTSAHDQLPISVREYLFIATTPLYRGSKTTVDLPAALTHVGVAPEKLDQSFMSLSGGERQRVAIARALLSKPTILVLDEPLAAVDYSSREGLYQLIRHLQQDHAMTALLVSHDVESILPISDRVLCLNRTLEQSCHPVSSLSEYNQPNIMHHHC
jgi:zinc transport system ATP-binding protein